MVESAPGLRNQDTVSWFADYAALIARELGDRVSMWSTFNEGFGDVGWRLVSIVMV
ncbi:MAG: family 1 glycosylhydrolase [Ilumatobacteraceae bacterium]|nr:family 1 glycosylhydrolase [Ilumatobacteraceae bacterium]